MGRNRVTPLTPRARRRGLALVTPAARSWPGWEALRRENDQEQVSDLSGPMDETETAFLSRYLELADVLLKSESSAATYRRVA